ncbi:hypothetical protein GXW74_11175 [Roseomonas eburnea]|uniref:Lipoprotein n=1 Tax=Neoroseomonas eburnea TaxID=1346889 RepID=A0A9X9XBG5_9PROT|nr:hypothetical protein [Neoroseomonas eburnea]MBR0681051.1 hypothetical protein [Neoroseomonas eburnea]
MALRPAAILLPLLVLGCAADRGEEAAALMQDALRSAQASLAVAGGGVPRAVAEAPAAPAPAVVSVAAATPRARGTEPPAAAALLLGARAEQMRRMLGDPTLRRPEGEAEIWLYEAPNCRLDVILYPEGGALVVGHASARAHGAAEGVTEAACLSAIATTPGTTRRA